MVSYVYLNASGKNVIVFTYMMEIYVNDYILFKNFQIEVILLKRKT